MRRIILYAAIVEIIYLTASFFIAQAFGQWSYEGELIRTLLRVITIVFYGYCYQKYFYKENSTLNRKTIFSPQLAAALLLFLCFALVYTNAENESVIWQLVFVISGITAGLREELFYRGIIQNTLQKKYSFGLALLLATIIFALSHVQYIYYGQLTGLLFISCAGIVFGSLFIITGSVAFTAIIHGLYDALLSVNIIPFRLSNDVALTVLLLIALFFLVITKKLFKTNDSNHIQASQPNEDDFSIQ